MYPKDPEPSPSFNVFIVHISTFPFALLSSLGYYISSRQRTSGISRSTWAHARNSPRPIPSYEPICHKLTSWAHVNGHCRDMWCLEWSPNIPSTTILHVDCGMINCSGPLRGWTAESLLAYRPSRTVGIFESIRCTDPNRPAGALM